MIAVIDYGMGNHRSVLNALQALGQEAAVTADAEVIKRAHALILPGVGAFGDGMRNLRAANLVDVLEKEVMQGGKPLLGLCLGLQLLATRSYEMGVHEGLGWIRGEVKRLSPDDPSLRIPHMGWNDVEFVASTGIYAGMKAPQSFYFVHSFALVPEDEAVVTGRCHYGTRFVASVESGNVCATQFHPEKSHKVGLALLKNWCAGIAKC